MKEARSKVQAATSDQQQYLTFVLGGEMFAIGILAVKEIIEYGGMTVKIGRASCRERVSLSV